MAETVESKQQKLDKLKARQQALVAQAKEVGKRIARVESAENAKRRKEDNRAKLLLGVAIFEAAKVDPAVRQILISAARKLRPNELKFLIGESRLYAELLDQQRPGNGQQAAP